MLSPERRDERAKSVRKFLDEVENAPSLWGWAKKRSTYDFDYTKKDETNPIQVIGRVHGEWEDELDQEVPVVSGKEQVEAETVPSEKADLDNWGYSGWGYDSLRPTAKLQRMADLLQLKHTSVRHNRQPPGFSRWYHIDTCNCHFAQKMGSEATDDFDIEIDDKTFLPKGDTLMRVFIMLTDWEPGHYIVIGKTPYQFWKKGDIWTFDWVNVPHGTANCGHTARSMLKVVGYIDKGSEWMTRGEFREFQLD